MKLGHLAALHRNRADAVHAIQRGFEIVGGDLPQARLWNGVRGEAVTQDREGGKGEPVGGDHSRLRQRLADFAECGIDQLEGVKHILIPVEEETDLRCSAAGGGTYGFEPRDGVYRVLNRLGDDYLHLLDRHDTVVNADDYTGKIRLGKDGDGDCSGEEYSGQREHHDKEENGAR